MNHGYHRPVLLEESLHALAIRPDGCYLDATFGRGGHSRAILARLGPGGRLLGLDRDPQAVAVGRELAAEDGRFQIAQGPFSRVAEAARAAGVERGVDGLLVDLGVSSPQLDDPARGFSFSADGPLDMRMDPGAGEPARDWLAHAKQAEIARVLRDYGEERFAGRIAAAIVRERAVAPLTTTRQLAAICEAAVPTREPGKHPATRTFQALRIAVNGELEQLAALLDQVLDLLAVGGRLVVISFHSLEDRLVKRFIRDQARGEQFPRGVPVMDRERHPRLRAIGKGVRAGSAEVAENPRARSALMRVAERLP
ncbi:16S rRNA (cytosine(1402)-N(4))-methyltransferase RsmH [Thiococcus pfennigii]|jgi:16S rRNA (cytosine1402-N4)-methyltransferase|uniref:16S rRNA (cytosine(1402)-N(4))-methyltransferase RsmH n=1 Tax=Thiococcus pfennigii TaxID=1057 RepID=UPI0019088FCC|nr:16S rRNA (cytosine(1402)-N(4))-methyltransferase RsmH [Thiococcus pfennigii]MBK1699684.1 16S rRNA (cytosine(1402)-N(4))-methyltransferase [Thiococcus pfennigii]MBK1731533.1 16S rRNA (cytosine(1402)-N(4))-methyltransferase [Thiococcus pfennigii]